jgi:uncharacterized protein YoaH (UPF0181 family)
MHWYNPKVGKVEDVRAPSTDEEALEMLSGHPDSDRFVERYVVLREEGMSVEQALVFVGHRLRMFHLRYQNLAAHENFNTSTKDTRRAKEAHRYGQAHFGADGIS